MEDFGKAFIARQGSWRTSAASGYSWQKPCESESQQQNASEMADVGIMLPCSYLANTCKGFVGGSWNRLVQVGVNCIDL